MDTAAVWTALLTPAGVEWKIEDQSLRSHVSGYGLLLSELLVDRDGPWEQAIGRLVTWPVEWAERPNEDDTPATLYADGILTVSVAPERDAGRRTGRLRAVVRFEPDATEEAAVRRRLEDWMRTLTPEQRGYPEVQGIGILRGEPLRLLRLYYAARLKCRKEAKKRVAEHVRCMAEG